jgi:hypothetical protein
MATDVMPSVFAIFSAVGDTVSIIDENIFSSSDRYNLQ